MLVVYITLILAEGGNSLFEVLPWALVMAIATIAAFAATAIHNHHLARNLMIGSAVVFAMLGLVSIFSIGLGFLATAVLATVAAIQLAEADRA